jgi:hypothetical protein
MKPKGSKEKKVKVLYQKLGGQWFAFTEIKGEVFFTRVSEEDIKGKVANDETTSTATAKSR